MWLHKLDSYRILNVEMQMKRGHPSAFVGASLLLLYMVGRSSSSSSRQLRLSRSSGAEGVGGRAIVN